MPWLQSIDSALFRFINDSLHNPVFDWLMPLASDTPGFHPVALLLAAILFWKGGLRGKLCVAFLLLAIALGDSLVCNTIKYAVARPRPFQTLDHVRLLVGKGSSFSMPSSHAANWCAAATIAFIFFRRSSRFMVPLALLVSFSRIYNGVHYPSDVLAGAILGAGSAAWLAWVSNRIWQYIGPRWFPLWWRQIPSLLDPSPNPSAPAPTIAPPSASPQQHWLRLGYLLIFILFCARLAFLAAGKIDLSEDEAYQWLWSKHPALSYYSKPPIIAGVQFLGTHLFGDNPFGIRFFSPVISALISVLLLRFFAREAHPRLGVALILAITATPLLAAGSVLMTIDPISVLFWTAAMMTGWRAVQMENLPSSAPAPSSSAGISAGTRCWLLAGLWMGLGTLSKYTNLFQWISWALFFVIWPPARKSLRRPGPYLALLINVFCFIPVILWNSRHGWITLDHVASDGRLHETWQPTLKYVVEFLGAELGLLNPVFFGAMIFAAAAFWKVEKRNPLFLFLFCMGAPLFLFYFLFSFHSRVLPNWIAPSILPLFSLAAIFWSRPDNKSWKFFKPLFCLGTGLGLFAVILMHDTNLIQKIFHRALPPKIDPHHRIHGWKETAAAIDAARHALESEGKPVFIIADHYGITSQVSFYLPEAKAAAQAGRALVYFRMTDRPENQFYFWPDYHERHGQNAIFVREADDIEMVPGWFPKWLRGDNELQRLNGNLPPISESLRRQFDSITDLGIQEIRYRDHVMRRIQLFECRNLR